MHLSHLPLLFHELPRLAHRFRTRSDSLLQYRGFDALPFLLRANSRRPNCRLLSNDCELPQPPMPGVGVLLEKRLLCVFQVIGNDVPEDRFEVW